MARKRRPDYAFFLLTLVLIALGVIFVFDASSVLAKDTFGDPLHFAKRQAFWAVLGVLVFIGALFLPYRLWARREVLWSLFLLEVALLAWTYLNPPLNGAHRWILLGSLSFQPAELAKPLLICLWASLLIRARERNLPPLAAVVQTGLPLAVLVLLILPQPDLGTVFILVLLLLSMWLLWGMPLRVLLATGVAGVLLFGVLILGSDYRRRRVEAYFHPDRAIQAAAFQQRQSLIALGSGGLRGRFLGGSIQKARYLPEPHNDFIFAIVGEETGFLGAVTLLVLYLAWAFLAFRTAVKVKEPFGSLVAMGITSWVIIQALLNMGVVTGLLPTKGLPLPFISYGGSSLVTLCLGVGILANVSWER